MLDEIKAFSAKLGLGFGLSLAIDYLWQGSVVRRNSCYNEGGCNSCNDKTGHNSCYNKAGCIRCYDELGRIGILLRILQP